MKQYWALLVEGESGKQWKFDPNTKVEAGDQAASAMGVEALEARPLGRNRQRAEEAVEALVKEARRAANERKAASRDVEANVLRQMRKLVEAAEKTKAEFVVRLSRPNHRRSYRDTLAWVSGDVLKAEDLASYANRVISGVEHGINPIKGLRETVDALKIALVGNHLQGTSTGRFHRAVDDTERESAASFVSRFGVLGGFDYQVIARDEAREKLGMKPIDLDAPYVVLSEAVTA